MNTHRYILEKYKGRNTRYNCPNCKKREFVRYIDTETNKHLSPDVGKCNRIDNCGYHYSPSQYFKDNNIVTSHVNKPINIKPLPPQQKLPSIIPVEIFKESLSGFENNNFVRSLLNIFEPDIVGKLVSRYFIGTSTHWPGSTVFWQIDLTGKIRAGKIMLYNAETGKRVKQPYDYITWVHKALKMPDFSLSQCFFGTHLLRDKSKPVGMVESEKTAIICSVYFPKLIWLAAGNAEGLNAEKCKVLQRRKVVLFPDLNQFDKWTDKAKELFPQGNCTIFDLLERKATEIERLQGLDLADYMVRYDYREFTKPTPINQPVKPLIPAKGFDDFEPLNDFKKVETPKPENWLPEIQDLEQFFKTAPLPAEPLIFDTCTKITDIRKFIDCELSICKGQNGNPRFKPYLERLQELKRILKLNLN
jgi:hypothetical protein